MTEHIQMVVSPGATAPVTGLDITWGTINIAHSVHKPINIAQIVYKRNIKMQRQAFQDG
jgi:hypothetical protein